MIKKSLVPCFLVLLSFAGQAQTKAPNIVQNGLALNYSVFDSEKEKDLLSKTSFSDAEYLNLFIIAGGGRLLAGYDQKLTAFIENGKYSKAALTPKELKKLYKEVHQVFFKKYVDNPGFEEIFTTGAYNCATASALYGLILNRLSIKYDLHETPDHVYLVAAPLSGNIIFETTAPGMKILQLSDKFKSEYLEYLVSNKLVSEAEMKSESKNQLFEKHYYNDEKIDLKQLAGLLYYNVGINATVNKDFEKAYKSFEKAYILYPSKRIAYLAGISLLASLADKQISDEELPAKYMRYFQLSPTATAGDLISNYWKDFMQKNIFESPNISKVYPLWNQLKIDVKDSVLNRSMKYNYYFSMAHYHDIKKALDSSLIYLDSAFHINPENILVHELIEKTILEMTDLNEVANARFLEKLDRQLNRYSFLNKNGKLGNLYCYSLSRVVSKNYEEDNLKEGEKYYTMMKNLVNNDPAVAQKNEEVLSIGLVNIYYYYVRNKKYKEAKQFLSESLKYFPDNAELKKRVTAINNILNQ